MRLLRSLLVLIASAGMLVAADAKTFTLGTPPLASITIPDDWNPRDYGTGVEANAPDDGIYVAAEAVKVADVAAATAEGIRFFQKSGVTLDQGTMKKRETQMNGMPAVDVSWEGKDKDGPTNVSLTFVIVNDAQSVLLYAWGTDDDLKEAADAMQAIAASLKPVAR